MKSTANIFCCLTLLLAFASTVFAQSQGEPQGHPLEVINGSGSGDYRAGDSVYLTANVPQGYSFVAWIIVQGRGIFEKKYSAYSKFTMPDRGVKIVATFARIEAWFPPGPEDNSEGILLPKAGSGTVVRLEHKVRVTVNRGAGAEDVAAEDVWNSIKAQIGWFPAPECETVWHSSEMLKYFDQKEDGRELPMDSALPRSLFSKTGADGPYEASVFYEGIWTQALAAQKLDEEEQPVPPKVLTGFKLVIVGVNFAQHRQSTTGTLLPFEVVSDLNNNGKIDGGDRTLKSEGAKEDATDEEIEKATEYLFANDNLSNGAWDKDDSDPDKPQDATDDDDAEEISVTCATTWGAVWFEHPIIEKLAFYKTRECNAADKVTFPVALSSTNALPEKLYVRAEEVTVQVEGDLVMKFGKFDKTETWAEDTLIFTIAKELGDDKYFHAARDYILENNTELFVHRKGYPVDDPDTVFSICAMREEATQVESVEAFYRGSGKLYGMGDVVSNRSDFTVVTNGNQVFFSDGWEPAPPLFFDEDHVISDKCHGRLIYGGVLSPASSDNMVKSTVPPGSPLAGPDGNYVAQNSPNGPFTLALAQVPNQPYPWMGLGGLSTYYADPIRENLPQTIVGYAPVTEAGKGVVFTASQPPLGGGNPGFPSGGYAPELAADANRSGVPAMPGAPTGRYKLLILDSGRTSVALAHINPARTLNVEFSGTKHSVGYPYYVNTYLGFKSAKPRLNP